MKKIIAASLLAAMTSPSLFAASVTSECANQQLTLVFSLNDGETCTAEEALTINGNTSSETYEVMNGDRKAIDLEAGDSANATVTLSCRTQYGSMSLSAGAGTENGCTGSASRPTPPTIDAPPVTAQPPVSAEPPMPSNPIGSDSPIEALNSALNRVVDSVTRRIEFIQTANIQSAAFTESSVRMLKRMTEMRLNALERQFSDTESVALIDEARQMLNDMIDAM